MLRQDLPAIFLLCLDSISGNLSSSTLKAMLFRAKVQNKGFVGISENVGHDMTFKILNSSTNKIINRSNVRSAKDKEHPNLRAEPLNSPEVIRSLQKKQSENEDGTLNFQQEPFKMIAHLLPHLRNRCLLSIPMTLWGEPFF